MTAPALPGALPPEVESAISSMLGDAALLIGKGGSPLALVDSINALRTAIARALGGDGEPVAKRTGWDVIGPTGIVLGSPSRAECESVAARLNAIESGSSCPVRYTVAPHYESRPAAPASVDRRMAFLGVDALTARVARLEAALREIAGRGPKDDPCAAEYGADGKRRDQFGSEASWCTFTSDESQEESAHASDVEAYAAAKIARAALDEGSKT